KQSETVAWEPASEGARPSPKPTPRGPSVTARLDYLWAVRTPYDAALSLATRPSLSGVCLPAQRNRKLRTDLPADSWPGDRSNGQSSLAGTCKPGHARCGTGGAAGTPC